MRTPTTEQKLMYLNPVHIFKMTMGDASDAAMYRRRIAEHGIDDMDNKAVERVNAMYEKYFVI